MRVKWQQIFGCRRVKKIGKHPEKICDAIIDEMVQPLNKLTTYEELVLPLKEQWMMRCLAFSLFLISSFRSRIVPALVAVSDPGK